MSHGNFKCVVCTTLTLEHLGRVVFHRSFQCLNNTRAHSQVWQWGVASGSTKVPCLLEITLSPAQELRAGLAAALLVSLNFGKDFNRQGCLFPVPEDMLHLLSGKGRSCPLNYFSSLQFFEQFFPLYILVVLRFENSFFMWNLFSTNADPLSSSICNINTADSSSAPILVRNAV